MIALMLVGAALVSTDGGEPAPREGQKAYEAASEQAGRNPDAHVRLALWCEARGWSTERLKHLAKAVLIDPKNVAARGLMGVVAYQGKWQPPDAVGEKIKADEELSAKLAAYNLRRDALAERLEGRDGKRPLAGPDAARAHVELGAWCRQNGLEAEATAHFTTAVVLDPNRDSTWRNLGYVKYDGRWVSPEQAAAERQTAEAQRRADRRWEPLLKKWRAWLNDPVHREDAQAALADVTDPLAVPAIVRVFGEGKEANQLVAIKLLSVLDTTASTRALAALAVGSRAAAVRSAATTALKGRIPRDYAGTLVDMIHSPMRYRVRPVGGPGSPGAMEVETPRFRMLRTYDAPPVFELGSNFFGYIGYDQNGLPVAARGVELRRMSREGPVAQERDLAMIEARTAAYVGEAQWKAMSSQQRLQADIGELEAANARTVAANERISAVLKDNLGASELRDDEDAWHVWWYDQLGYRYTPSEQVQVAVNASPQSSAATIRSCFIAGTPVRTRDGLRPIETLRVGDQVLCQDASTGALDFQPVMVVHRNPPGQTVRVELDDGEVIVPSIYHRFWRAGRGWAMARELEAGDTLRTLGGLAKIVSVGPGEIAPVYNLDVARFRTYFVGQRGALVHDNTLPEPRIKPFDGGAHLVPTLGGL